MRAGQSRAVVHVNRIGKEALHSFAPPPHLARPSTSRRSINRPQVRLPLLAPAHAPSAKRALSSRTEPEEWLPESEAGVPDAHFLFLLLVTDARLRRQPVTKVGKATLIEKSSITRKANMRKAKQPQDQARSVHEPRAGRAEVVEEMPLRNAPTRRRKLGLDPQALEAEAEAEAASETTSIEAEDAEAPHAMTEEQSRAAEEDHHRFLFLMLATDGKLRRRIAKARTADEKHHRVLFLRLFTHAATGQATGPSDAASALHNTQRPRRRRVAKPRSEPRPDVGPSKWVTRAQHASAASEARQAAEERIRLVAEESAHALHVIAAERRRAAQAADAEADARHAAMPEHQRAAAYYELIKARDRLARAREAGAAPEELASLEEAHTARREAHESLASRTAHPLRSEEDMAQDDGTILSAHREYRRATRRRQECRRQRDVLSAAWIAAAEEDVWETREVTCLRYTDPFNAAEREKLDSRFARYAKRPKDRTKIPPRRPAGVDDDSIAAAHNARQAARYKVRKARRNGTSREQLDLLIKAVHRLNDVYKQRFRDPARAHEKRQRTERERIWARNKRVADRAIKMYG